MPLFFGVNVDDEPEKLMRETVYVVGIKFNKWLAMFICPCGCNSCIKLNLLKESRPRWTVKIHKNHRVTIKPSIWRIEGCKSHFTIRNGKVNWVYDTDDID